MKKYVTDIKNHIYLKESDINMKKTTSSQDNIINIDCKKIVSKYLGMGGAITESVAYNYFLLTDKNKKRFINDCYSEKGLNYRLGRISIGSCDFSLGYYSYAKKKDLSDFSIDRDKRYVIPLLKDILKTKKIILVSSPWSPPKMYKKIKLLNYGIKLAKRYYDSYSNYLIKYLEYYRKEGINIEYLTMQNEPLARQKWESCKFDLEEQKDFIYQYLLPKLANCKLLLYDHNKDDLFNKIECLYQENSKVAGVAFHNYSGQYFNELRKINEKYHNLLLINTEGCCGYSEYNELSWISDAEYYLNDIIGDFNNGCNAYLDWNILLDERGGSCHVKNPVKSMLILKNGDYIKTPIYYYIYHISHFINYNMDIIFNNMIHDKIKVIVFKNNKKIIIVVMNKNNLKYSFQININNNYINDSINSHSIITYEINL